MAFTEQDYREMACKIAMPGSTCSVEANLVALARDTGRIPSYERAVYREAARTVKDAAAMLRQAADQMAAQERLLRDVERVMSRHVYPKPDVDPSHPYGVLVRVREALAVLSREGSSGPEPAATPETCEWKQDEDGDYFTACDQAFSFINDGGPEANDMRFCCFCSKPLREVPFNGE